MFRTSLNKFWQLSPGEQGMLLRAFLLLPLIHIGLTLLGYYHLHRIMEKLVPLKDADTRRSEGDILQQAREITRIVAIAAGHGFYKATCLRRSLLVWWLFRERGIQADICFGVRKTGHQLEAHAWVERNGVVVNDSESVSENYQPLRDILPSTKTGL